MKYLRRFTEAERMNHWVVAVAFVAVSKSHGLPGVEEIERIEVVRGPMSGVYGSGAIGGVINLITKRSGGVPATLKASIYGEHIGRLNTTATGTRVVPASQA